MTYLATERGTDLVLLIMISDVKPSGYLPGAIGRVAELHGRYYHEHRGFDLFSESKVATELSEFLCRFNQARDGFWIVSVEGKIVGSIAIEFCRRGEFNRVYLWTFAGLNAARHLYEKSGFKLSEQHEGIQ